jgi:hypothetical protein
VTEAEYELGRSFLVRLRYNAEIPKAITDFARDKKIDTATFTLVGALKRAKIAYYDQMKKEYRVIEFQGPQEIASCSGNLSYHDGKPFVHAHVVLADERGDARAGHLLEGVVFAVELHLQELRGPKLQRVRDETTGLALWRKSRM